MAEARRLHLHQHFARAGRVELDLLLLGGGDLGRRHGLGRHGLGRHGFRRARGQGEQNGGVGRALFEQALAWLERDGPRTLWISVWSENYGAQRFYGRHGFEFAGEYAFIVGEQRDREFMYRRDPRNG